MNNDRTYYINKLRAYIYAEFSPYEETEEMNSIRSEMFQNLCDRFDDAVAEGADLNSAYTQAIDSIGDIRELVGDTQLKDLNTQEYTEADIRTDTHYGSETGTYTENSNRDKCRAKSKNIDLNDWSIPSSDEVSKYRAHKAFVMTVAIALYVLCVVPVVIIQNTLGVVILFLMVAVATAVIMYVDGVDPVAIPLNEDRVKFDRKRRSHSARCAVAVAMYICTPICPILLQNEYGVGLMFALAAAATAIFVYDGCVKYKVKYMTVDSLEKRGINCSENNASEKAEKINGGKPKKGAPDGISSALWITTFVLYFFISFNTGRWDVTWLCFLIAIAANNLIDAIFDLVREKSIKNRGGRV